MQTHATYYLHKKRIEEVKLIEPFQVAAIIENLSPMWKDFMNNLKCKRKEMRLQDLIMILKIEEND